MKRCKAGFTLVEIMIVVLIIGLLAAIAIPSFVRARDRARANSCINNLRQIEYAKETWAMEQTDPAALVHPAFGPEHEAWDAIRGGWATVECPAGGNIQAGALGVTPTCTEDGHVLDLPNE